MNEKTSAEVKDLVWRSVKAAPGLLVYWYIGGGDFGGIFQGFQGMMFTGSAGFATITVCF